MSYGRNIIKLGSTYWVNLHSGIGTDFHQTLKLRYKNTDISDCIISSEKTSCDIEVKNCAEIDITQKRFNFDKVSLVEVHKGSMMIGEYCLSVIKKIDTCDEITYLLMINHDNLDKNIPRYLLINKVKKSSYVNYLLAYEEIQ